MRALAAVIDLAIFAAVFLLVETHWGRRTEPMKWQVNGLPACALIVFPPAYWLITEGCFAGTPGKLALGLRVFSVSGSELTFAQVLKRNVVKLLESPMLYLTSAAVALTNPLRQSLGDVWAKTMVTEVTTVQAWRAGPGGQSFDQWLKGFRKPERPEASTLPGGPVA